MKLVTIGKWAFIVGLVIAVIAGIFLQAAWVVWVLAILGVIVGFLYITAEETQNFLLAAIALTLSATALATIPMVGGVFTNILGFLAAFVAGTMVVLALKTLLMTARK